MYLDTRLNDPHLACDGCGRRFEPGDLVIRMPGLKPLCSACVRSLYFADGAPQ